MSSFPFAQTLKLIAYRMDSTIALYPTITEMLRLNDQQMNATRRLEIYVMPYVRSCLRMSITEVELQYEPVKLVNAIR